VNVILVWFIIIYIQPQYTLNGTVLLAWAVGSEIGIPGTGPNHREITAKYLNMRTKYASHAPGIRIFFSNQTTGLVSFWKKFQGKLPAEKSL
jgi:hypothetical protein